ncbi:MAG: GH25 family lysozyme, partial [Anaerolineaceae bacterium]
EPVSFTAIKASEGDNWTDAQFARNWSEAKRLGLCRLAYHFVRFSDNAQKQMDLLLRTVNPEAQDRLVLDVEAADGWSRAHITTTLRVCLNILRERTGRYPIIYSRAGWVNQYLDVSALPDIDWWLAQYRLPYGYPAYTPEAASPPALPKGVKNWLIHQTGERGDGKSFGAESHYIDTDRWNGTAEDVRKYFGHPAQEPESEVPLFQARVNVDALNVRSGAGINNSAIGLLRLGDEVDVYEERERWYRIGADRWCAGWLTIKISEPITGGLDAPLYSQSDPAWRYDRLGRSTTIGANGCLLTGVAMLLKYWSKDTDPRRLNAAMKKAGGYSGNLWIWEALTKLYPDIVMDWDNWIVSQGGYTLSRIDALLTADTPVLAQTDYNPATAYLDQHWVLMTGKQGDDYIINDPVDGQRVLFNTRYGEPAKKIFRIAAYKKVN